MDAPPGAPPWLEVLTAQERPDLWELAGSERMFDGLWPEYNMHGTHAAKYFGALIPRFAHLQAVFLDRQTHAFVARARSIPFWWDGRLETLPRGIDSVGLQAVKERRPATALSALAAEVRPEHQRGGLSSVVLATMVAMARHAGLSPLVAPVRPMWKDRFPLHPIEDYAFWQRRDGLPFDPWIRLHVRLGARILRPEPTSMEFTAAVSEWEQWTGMRFPRDGSYLFPSGLAPLTVSGATGHYWEPNVWMRHDVNVDVPSS